MPKQTNTENKCRNLDDFDYFIQGKCLFFNVYSLKKRFTNLWDLLKDDPDKRELLKQAAVKYFEKLEKRLLNEKIKAQQNES